MWLANYKLEIRSEAMRKATTAWLMLGLASLVGAGRWMGVHARLAIDTQSMRKIAGGTTVAALSSQGTGLPPLGRRCGPPNEPHKG